MILLQKIHLQIKAVGVSLIIPFLIVLVLIPGVVAIKSLHELDLTIVTDFARDLAYSFIPIFSAILLYMFQYEQVEGADKEIFLLGRSTTGYTLFYYFVNVVTIWISLHLMNLEDDFYVLAIITFFIMGLAFFLNFSLKSITSSMIITILYICLSNVTVDNTLGISNETLPIFFSSLKETGIDDFLNVIYVAVGIVFWMLGWYKSKRI